VCAYKAEAQKANLATAYEEAARQAASARAQDPRRDIYREGGKNYEYGWRRVNVASACLELWHMSYQMFTRRHVSHYLFSVSRAVVFVVWEWVSWASPLQRISRHSYIRYVQESEKLRILDNWAVKVVEKADALLLQIERRVVQYMLYCMRSSSAVFPMCLCVIIPALLTIIYAPACCNRWVILTWTSECSH